jgi:hypothetical protein
VYQHEEGNSVTDTSSPDLKKDLAFHFNYGKFKEAEEIPNTTNFEIKQKTKKTKDNAKGNHIANS